MVLANTEPDRPLRHLGRLAVGLGLTTVMVPVLAGSSGRVRGVRRIDAGDGSHDQIVHAPVEAAHPLTEFLQPFGEAIGVRDGYDDQLAGEDVALLADAKPRVGDPVVVAMIAAATASAHHSPAPMPRIPRIAAPAVSQSARFISASA